MLKVCDGEVVVPLYGPLVAFNLVSVSPSSSPRDIPDAYSFIVLTQGRMYDSTVEQYLRGIRDAIERLQRLLEFLIVVLRNSLNPGLDLLHDHIVSVDL